MRSLLTVVMFVVLALGLCRQGLAADAPATQPASRPAGQIVTLTEKAAAQIKSVAATQTFRRYWLRIGVRAQPRSSPTIT